MTTFDCENILYQLLNQSPLKTEISGGIYKRERPQDSKLEDVVISSIVIDSGSLKSCICNVNIHVSDIDISISGKQQKMPDNHRLSQLAVIAEPVLKNRYGTLYNLWIANQSTFKESETNQHFVNFRIQFNIIDLTF